MSLQLPPLTLVLGGASSGKSAFAERLVLGTGLAPVYLATAWPGEAETDARIAAHRAARGEGWRTIEAPERADAHIPQPAEACVLFDSVTLWAAANADVPLAELCARLEAGLDGAPGPVVAVSDEIGLGVVPENRAARAFRELLGGLNQWLAARAGLVVAVHAGLPLVLKGSLPEGVA